jgi:hypothetical protein
MRYFIKIVLILCVLSTLSFAQRQQYFDAPFGGGGGFTPGWIFPNFDQVNPVLKQFGVPEFSKGGFFTTGGSGFIYLGFIKNFRVGGIGFGGSKSTSSSQESQLLLDKSLDKNSVQAVVNKEVQYSLGGGGLTLEYTLPFIKNVGISVGGIIGGGSLSMEIYKNSGTFSWDDVWNEISGPFPSGNEHKTIKNNFWFFTPTVNVDIPAFRFVAFRIGAGYQLTFANKWTIDNNQNLSNVPSDLNGNSFFIQTGIFIGFFSF